MTKKTLGLNGIKTDISWIKETLERIEGKVNCLEKKTISLLVWRAKIIGISIGVSALISTIGVLIRFYK